MPNITVELLRGRTLQQRRQFVEALTDDVVTHLGARREDVRIVFTEIGGHDVANGGVLAADDASRAEVLARHGQTSTS